ncbi:class I SAM-dependent methyltransferase [candidate division KSB1 bacterium]|nr:class I SAM-dependent methyltransferase [candidate division KSB1 bacterium]RQW01693.1 MAG: class I SAM-dependent methyltransferase [candidate division KSB1 bacterium]
MTATRQHNQHIWELFWEQSIEEVYANSERIIDQIRAVGDIENKRIMEVGAGSGRDSLKLVDLGAQAFVLDYAVNSLRRIRELALKQQKTIHLVRGDAFHMPFKADSIDIIFHQGLLEHFTNPEDILKESYYATKIGGRHISDVPQRFHLYTVVKHLLIWLNRWFAGWETEFSIGQLKRLHTEAGYLVRSAYGDWMRPSFFYRATRQALKKVGIRLPLYPRRVPVLSALRDRWRGYFKKQRIAFYTFMDIGVVAEKKD